MKKNLLLSLHFLAFTCSVFSQSSLDGIGAQNSAMGNASLLQTNVFSTNNNSGASAFAKFSEIGINAMNLYGLDALYQFSGAGILATKAGNFGSSFIHFGNPTFSQNKIGISYGKKLGETFGVGVQLLYLNTQIIDEKQSTVIYENGKAFTFDIGIRYEILKKFVGGAKIYNPIQASIGSNYTEEKIPTIIQVGFAYLPSEKIEICLEAEQEFSEQLRIKSGIEYHIIEALFLRAGFLSNPSQLTTGVGIKLKELSIDLAAQFHPQLGITPGIGMQYQFQQ